jgi:hypothetical protein
MKIPESIICPVDGFIIKTKPLANDYSYNVWFHCDLKCKCRYAVVFINNKTDKDYKTINHFYHHSKNDKLLLRVSEKPNGEKYYCAITYPTNNEGVKFSQEILTTISFLKSPQEVENILNKIQLLG